MHKGPMAGHREFDNMKLHSQDVRRLCQVGEDDDRDFLALSLSSQPSRPPPEIPQSVPLPPPETQQPVTVLNPFLMQPPPPRTGRGRRSSAQVPANETVPVPYPWATNRRAAVQSLNQLIERQIFTIPGRVQCKRCERVYEIEYDVREKFLEIGTFVAKNKDAMHDRAPDVWMNPILPKCRFCEQESCVKPVLSEKKKAINWLFLFLGQMLGCCTLEQLKYFCKHTGNHRTGAKDRVLYLTYLNLCKQLDPTGPFDR